MAESKGSYRVWQDGVLMAFGGATICGHAIGVDPGHIREMAANGETCSGYRVERIGEEELRELIRRQRARSEEEKSPHRYDETREQARLMRLHGCKGCIHWGKTEGTGCGYLLDTGRRRIRNEDGSCGSRETGRRRRKINMPPA